MKYNFRAGFLLLLLPLLASCLVTTDRLAVYKNSLLSQTEIDALIGHYHLLDNDGNFNSLSIKPRSATWNSQNGTQQFISTNVIYKNGGSIPFHFEGVGILSRIPESDFVLVGVPGETIRFRKDGKMISVPKNEVESASHKNHLFVIKKNGQALEFYLPSSSKKALKEVFAKPRDPLPTEKYLTYLKENIQSIFQNEKVSTFIKSNSKPEGIVEKKIDEALTEKEKKELEKRKKRLEAEKQSSKETTTTQKPAATPGTGQTAKPQPQKYSWQRNNKPKGPRIESIDGYYSVSSNEIIQFKLYKKHKDSYEYKGFRKFKSDPWGFRHVLRNDYIEHGHWYPDSQQFYAVMRFEGSHQCEWGWSEWNWSYPVMYEEVVQKTKKVPAWAPDIFSSSSIPPGRKKKRICRKIELRASDCSFVRCIKKTDPISGGDYVIVRTLKDAIWVYKNHYGNR